RLIPMPCGAFEHLLSVPVKVFRVRPPIGVLRIADRLAMVGHQGFLKSHRAVSPIGDSKQSFEDSESPKVECLMMQDAQRKAVGFSLRAAGLIPADVSGVESDGDGAETDVESADSTPIFVGSEKTSPRVWVALSPRCDCLRRQPDRVQDVLV